MSILVKCKEAGVGIFNNNSQAYIYLFNKRNTIDILDVVMMFLLLTLNIFHTFF